MVDAPNDHDEPSNYGYNDLQTETGGVQRYDIELQPYYYVSIHFKNVNPCDQNDFISFSAVHGGTEFLNGAGLDT